MTLGTQMDNELKLMRIFRDAECFYKCAVKVLGENNKNGSIKIMENSQLLTLVAPFCVNIAFACELYFKMLLLYKGVDIPRTHKLDKLYYKLPKEQQKQLYTLFNETEENIEITKTNFMESLKNSSDLFMKYRYGFENGNLPRVQMMFVLNLAEYLHRMCFNIKAKNDLII